MTSHVCNALVRDVYARQGTLWNRFYSEPDLLAERKERRVKLLGGNLDESQEPRLWPWAVWLHNPYITQSYPISNPGSYLITDFQPCCLSCRIFIGLFSLTLLLYLFFIFRRRVNKYPRGLPYFSLYHIYKNNFVNSNKKLQLLPSSQVNWTFEKFVPRLHLCLALLNHLPQNLNKADLIVLSFSGL